MKMAACIVIEPFYGGSHAELVDILTLTFDAKAFTLPAKKWPWRMRASALHFALTIPACKPSCKTLFLSANMNLCDLVALRDDMKCLKKVLYFHENQLVYPVRKQQDRDFQFGYNQILSCLVADVIVFNSYFNMESFLTAIPTFLNLMPDYRPKNIVDLIKPKCQVLYFPLNLDRSFPEDAHINPLSKLGREQSSQVAEAEGGKMKQGTLGTERVLHILWPHRWEHDKGPSEFAEVVLKLKDKGFRFKVSLLGKQSDDIPEDFVHLQQQLQGHIVACGYVDKPMYWEILHDADVVVSTAKHEFFGLSIMEAVFAGCYPLCPNRLVYPELYPKQCLYNTTQQLLKRLESFCCKPETARQLSIRKEVHIEKFLWTNLKEDFQRLLQL